MYRIYLYDMGMDKPFKHIYMDRDGLSVHDDDSSAGCTVQDGRFDSNLSRIRRRVRDLILCNDFTFFCTFTFNGERVDRYNYDACRKRLTKWFNNFRSRYAPDFRYLVVPERHKDGAYHFHGVLSGIPQSEFYTPDKILKRYPDGKLRLVANTPGYVSWRRYEDSLGFFNCSVIKSKVATAVYCTKYITKQLADMPEGQHLIMTSAGLHNPQLLYDGQAPMSFKPDFECEFCKMAWLSADDTFSGPLPEWVLEGCSDVRDDPAAEAPAFEPVSAEQLSLFYR